MGIASQYQSFVHTDLKRINDLADYTPPMLASSARIRAVKRRFTRDIGCPNWVVSKSQFRWDCFRKVFLFTI